MDNLTEQAQGRWWFDRYDKDLAIFADDPSTWGLYSKAEIVNKLNDLEARLSQALEENERLRVQLRRHIDKLNRALEAARVAEAKAALATEMADWLREARERAGKVAGTFSGDWLNRYDAITAALSALRSPATGETKAPSTNP